MNPAFAPPPDYTRPEAEATSGRSAIYALLPRHLRDGMWRYFELHIETGSFLRAILEGEHDRARLLADPDSADGLFGIVVFLELSPAEAWGSPAKVAAWLAARKGGRVIDVPSAETRAHYETMSSDELLILRGAFEADYVDTPTDEGKDFCRGRLALIAEVLDKRGEDPEVDMTPDHGPRGRCGGGIE